jgi:hypothetical protein
MVVYHPDQLVDQKSLPMNALVSGARLFAEPPRQLGAAFMERGAQQLDDLWPSLLRTAFRDRGGDRLGKGATVDHRALVRDANRAHRLST